MKTVTKIEQHPPALPKKLRVAAYARVSKETDRLLHSFSEQVSYYNDLIQKNPEWEFAGVFADSGITGTMTACRNEFQKLMQECEEGRVDLILCKSISRFARNTVDLLQSIRRLKEIGVEVRFEKENISTFSSDGELMLSLLASFAQEESSSISDNVKWGIRKRFQDGTIGTTNKHILGYRYDEEKECYVIIPEEAESVRLMFQLFLDGASFRQIAKELNDRGILTIKGCHYQEGSVRSLLYNEIYAGDIIRQKSHIPDPISKVKVKNRGELPKFLYENAHEAIIDRETYERVKAEMKRRELLQRPDYFFTGLIRCEVCGSYYSRRKHSHKNGRTYINWTCRNKVDNSNCSSVNIREDTLISACIETVGEDYEEKITQISMSAEGNLHFKLVGGEYRTWQKPPNPVKEIPEKQYVRPPHLFDGKIFCGICGRRFGRSVSEAADKHLIWRCRNKSSRKPDCPRCESVNYTTSELERILCKAFHKTAFDEDYFKSTVSKMVIQKNGSVDFYTTDEQIIHQEAMKPQYGQKEKTKTKAFTGKIKCARCGNEYVLYSCRGKYNYWYCKGKSHTHVKCKASQLGDYDLRVISAYMMECDEFDDELFKSSVDYIEVKDKSLIYHFTDGSVRVWEKQ